MGTDGAPAAEPDRAEIARTFWSATGRANTVIVLLGLLLALTVAGLVTALNTLAFLRRVQAGAQVTEAEGERIDLWSLLVAVPAALLNIAVVVIYLMWVYRAHLNLKLFSGEKLNFSSGWAVGWWFIPFANLVQPCRVMGEIWRRSDPKHGASWSNSGAPTLLVLWWLAFLIEGVLGRVMLRLSIRAETLPELIRATHLEIATEIWDLIAIPLAIAVVVAIKRAQRRRLEELGDPTRAAGPGA